MAEEKDEKKETEKIKAKITGQGIYSNSESAFSLYESSRFGEKKENKVKYSSVEALYLVEKGKLEVYSGNKKLDFEQLMRKLKKQDKKIEINYLVFKDMRNRGYIVKTALKFGAEFRVYNKGKKPGEDHAKWILYPVLESQTMTWHEFSAKNRVAHSTKKNLLIGIIDEEGDISYYEISWTKP